MKLWEMVIEGQLRKNILISKNQFGFMPGRSTTEAIHLSRRLIKLYMDKKKDFHLVFIDLEKACDKVSCEVMWECLEKKDVPMAYMKVTKDMYEGVKITVRTSASDIEYFSIDIGFHQSLALNQFLFTIVMDELTREIHDEVPWCMLFADDIVRIDETRYRLNNKLEK